MTTNHNWLRQGALADITDPDHAMYGIDKTSPVLSAGMNHDKS